MQKHDEVLALLSLANLVNSPSDLVEYSHILLTKLALVCPPGLMTSCRCEIQVLNLVGRCLGELLARQEGNCGRMGDTALTAIQELRI